jgi:hypothetical protein
MGRVETTMTGGARIIKIRSGLERAEESFIPSQKLDDPQASGQKEDMSSYADRRSQRDSRARAASTEPVKHAVTDGAGRGIGVAVGGAAARDMLRTTMRQTVARFDVVGGGSRPRALRGSLDGRPLLWEPKPRAVQRRQTIWATSRVK